MILPTDVLYVVRIRIKSLTDTDTDDKNSLNVIQPVPFLSGYGCADTATDTETWNRGLLGNFLVALFKLP